MTYQRVVTEAPRVALPEVVSSVLPSAEAIPIIGVVETILADAVERGRAAGIRDFVAKFDRAGLIASIKAHTGQLGRAA